LSLVQGTRDATLETQGESLYSSDDGHAVVYFSSARRPVYVDATTGDRRTSQNGAVYNAPYKAWDGDHLAYAVMPGTSTPPADPQDFVRTDDLDAVAEKAFVRMHSFPFDPQAMETWLIQENTLIGPTIPAGMAAVTGIRNISNRAAWLLQSPSLIQNALADFSRASPLLRNESNPSALPMDRLQTLNRHFLWIAFPKDTVLAIRSLADPREADLIQNVLNLTGKSMLTENDFATLSGRAVLFKLSSTGQTRLDLNMMRLHAQGGTSSLPLAAYTASGDELTVDVGHFWLSPDGANALFVLRGEKKTGGSVGSYADLYLIGDLRTPFGSNLRSLRVAQDVAEAAAWSSDGQKFWFIKPSEGIYRAVAPSRESFHADSAGASVNDLSRAKVIAGKIINVSKGPGYAAVVLFLENHTVVDVEFPAGQYPDVDRVIDQSDPSGLQGYRSLLNRTFKIVNPQEVKRRSMTTEGLGPSARVKADHFNASDRFQIITGPQTQVSIE